MVRTGVPAKLGDMWRFLSIFGLCVAGVFGVMVVLIGAGPCFYGGDEKVDTTKTTINAIETGLKLYKARHGSFPTMSQGLAALVSEKMLDKPPKDGFNNDYVYLNEGGKYTIISYGKDGAPGGDGLDADINSNNMDGNGK